MTGEDSELEDIVNKGLEQNAVQLSIGILSAVNSLAQSNATTTDTSMVRDHFVLCEKHELRIRGYEV